MTLLVLVYVVHALDRSAMAVVIEPLRRELRLSDAQAGGLGGLAYGMAYAACCLPLGALIDRVNRRNLLAVLIATWSSATVLAGLASTYAALFATRALVGASEAGAGPTAISLASDLFGRERRASAYGLFYLGAGLGGAVAAAACGWLAGTYGWRVALLIAGGPGLVLALLVRTLMAEPARGASEPLQAGDPPPIGETIRFLWRQRSLMWIYVGVSAAGIAMSVIAAWTIPFLMRSHGLGLPSAGMIVGLMLAICVGTANLASGMVIDRIAGDNQVRRLAISTASLALAIPFACAGYAATDLWLAVSLIFVAEALLSSVLAPVLGLVVNLCRPRMRGVAASIRDLLANSIGYGVGPWLAGLVSVGLGGDAAALRSAIIATTIGGTAIAAIAFLLAMRTLTRDAARAIAPDIATAR